MNSLKRKIPVASFLCHNFGIPVDPLAPFTAFDETRNQLGLYPDASRYDDGIAFGLARAAAATYKDEKAAQEALRVPGYPDPQIDYFQPRSGDGHFPSR